MWCLITVSFFIWEISIASSIILSEKVSIVNEIAQENERNEEADERIVGGRYATCEEFPHQVSLVANNSFFCGGFIVSERFILTAAHCVENTDPYNVVIRSGSTFHTNGTILPLMKITIHPDYNKPTFDKDVAVMKTAKSIKFNSCTHPIKLPPKGLTAKSGTVITVSGWGRTQNGAKILEQLMAVNLTVVNHKLCQVAYFVLDITKNMICADGDFFLGGASTCEGDSGGVGAIDGIARGIVSFGRGCGQPLSPSVFTDISAPDIRNFIAKHTGL